MSPLGYPIMFVPKLLEAKNECQLNLQLGLARVLLPPGKAFEIVLVVIKPMLGSFTCVAFVHVIVACLRRGVFNHQDRRSQPSFSRLERFQK